MFRNVIKHEWDAKAKKTMAEDNIYCKIELIKNPSTGQIMLTTHLNPNAPNITIEEHAISWTPNLEEQQFLIDAISLLKKQQHHPLVTFRKKSNTLPNTQYYEEHIDSINQKIDDLPYAKNQTNQRQTTQTIEEIIRQNTKPI